MPFTKHRVAAQEAARDDVDVACVPEVLHEIGHIPAKQVEEYVVHRAGVGLADVLGAVPLMSLQGLPPPAAKVADLDPSHPAPSPIRHPRRRRVPLRVGAGPRLAKPSRATPAGRWDDCFEVDVQRPAGWDGASGKQRCVLAHADEQGCLGDMVAEFLGEEVDGHVMVEISRHRGGATYALRPGREWKPSSDMAKIQAAVPEFASVVRDLIADGVVEVRQMPDEQADFDDAAPLPADQVDRVLADPESWLPGTAMGKSVRIALILGGLERRQFSGPG